MEATILCAVNRCGSEVDQHYYCDSHYDEKISEAFEEGKKQGYDEGFKEGEQSHE